MTSDSVGQIGLDLKINGKDYKKQVKQYGDYGSKQLEGSFSNTFKNIGKMAVAAFSIKAIVDFTGSCLSLGSALTEVENITNVAFPGMSQQMNDFAKNAVTQFGLSETMAKRFTGMYGTMAKQFGFANQEAFEMGSTLAGLAGDVASFYDMSQDEAYTKLKAVFSGETEVLKDIGVVMTQNALDQYALANSYGKTTAKMSEQEKTALRYAFIQDQLSAATGDFVRTQDSWANQTRVLSLRFDQLKASLGKGFIALFTPIVKGINWVIASLQPLADSFASLIEMLTGTTSSGGGALTDTSSDIANATDSAGGLSDGLSDAGKRGEKAAKKINKSFSKVDTINKLTFGSESESESEGSGSGGTIIKGPSKSVEFPEAPKGAMEIGGEIKKLLDILAQFGAISFKPLLDALKGLWDAFKPIGKTLFENLLWALDNVLYPLSKWTIEDFIPAFLGLLEGALTILNPILKSFGEISKVIWDVALQPIAEWTGGAIITILTGIGDTLKNIGNWMSSNQGTVTTITAAVLGFFGAWKVVELMSFIQQSGGVVSCLKSIATSIIAGTIAKIKDKAETIALNLLYAKDFVKSIVNTTAGFAKSVVQITLDTAAKVANKIATAAHTVAQIAMNIATGTWNVLCGVATVVTTAFGAAVAFLTSPIGLVIVAITAIIGIIALLIKNWETVKEVTLSIWKGIQECIDIAVKAIQNVIETIFNAIKATVEFVWGGISSFFTGIWDGICSGIDTAINAVKDTIDSVLGTIKGIWEGMWSGLQGFISDTWSNILGIFNSGGKIFSGVVGGIADVFRNIVNAIISGINDVISWPFNKVNSILNNIRSFSILGAKPFSGLWGKNPLPVPQIPMLAQGGYVGANQPQLAMIGDNKRYGEIVAPEDKMMDMINTALNMQKENGSISGLDALISLIKELIQTVKNLSLKVDIDMKKMSVLLENAKKERQMIGG